MIQPINTASRMKATNPPTSGQYMDVNISERAGADPHYPRRTLALGVARDLLTGRGKRPGDLHAPLLTEHEPQLARRSQPIGMRRAKGRARPTPLERAQEILMKEAVFAARFRGRRPTIRHADPTPDRRFD